MFTNHPEIENLLQRFRASIGFIDVVWQTSRINVLRSKLIEDLVDMSPSQFKGLVMGNWFYRPMLKEWQYEKIISQNGFENVKLRLLSLFVEEKPLRERIQDVMDLREVGPFIASQFFSVISDQLIMYHDDLVKGIRGLFLELFAEEFQYHFADVIKKPTDAESYLEFNEICKAIRDIFCFKSLGEVHEFFVHLQQQRF